MYLLSLNNWDYVWITAFLAINFIIAYSFRRKNATSDAFLFASTKFDSFFAILGDFGLIEIILAAVAGAYFGFNAVYYVLFALLVQILCQNILAKRYRAANVIGFNDYIGVRFNKDFMLIITLITIILFVMCTSLAIAVMFKSMQAIMGFGFINNTMGLLGLTVAIVLIGGRVGVLHNKLFNSLIIILILLLSMVSAVIQFGGFSAIITNLTNLAQAQGLSHNHYLWSLPHTRHILIVIAAIVLGFAGFKLVYYSNEKQQKISIIGRACVLVLLILPGIIAIATPNTGGIPGKDIVTIMAQLPDGQTGYVVKAVDNQGKHGSANPGIVPPLLNPKTNLIESGQYNYGIATIVAIRHYLPIPLMILVLLLLLSGFMLSIGDYMLRLGQLTVNNFLIPLNWISKYGKIGELWSLQVSIVSYTGVTLIIAYFMFLHYNLLYYIALISLCLIIPLLAVTGMILLLPYTITTQNVQKK